MESYSRYLMRATRPLSARHQRFASDTRRTFEVGGYALKSHFRQGFPTMRSFAWPLNPIRARTDCRVSLSRAEDFASGVYSTQKRYVGVASGEGFWTTPGSSWWSCVRRSMMQRRGSPATALTGALQQ